MLFNKVKGSIQGVNDPNVATQIAELLVTKTFLTQNPATWVKLPEPAVKLLFILPVNRGYQVAVAALGIYLVGGTIQVL